MSECRRIIENLVAFLCGELGEAEKEKISRHLKTCSLCGQELKRLQQTLQSADSLNPEMEKALASVNWEALSENIVKAVWQIEARPRRLPWRERFQAFAPKLKPAFAGLLLGVLVGALASYLVFRGNFPRENGGKKFFASSDFLDKVDLEIARRETLNYLEKSQYVLLEFAGADTREGKFGSSGLAAEQARELLEKKKFLNPQLEKAQMAKAKEICDQIELLFYELAQISESLTEQQRQEIQNLIEQKKLLLKIKLLKKELQESEA
jgi:hypothetical protein